MLYGIPWIIRHLVHAQMIISAEIVHVRKANLIQSKCLFQWEQNAAPSMMTVVQCDFPYHQILAGQPGNGAIYEIQCSSLLLTYGDSAVAMARSNFESRSPCC